MHTPAEYTGRIHRDPAAQSAGPQAGHRPGQRLYPVLLDLVRSLVCAAVAAGQFARVGGRWRSARDRGRHAGPCREHALLGAAGHGPAGSAARGGANLGPGLGIVDQIPCQLPWPVLAWGCVAHRDRASACACERRAPTRGTQSVRQNSTSAEYLRTPPWLRQRPERAKWRSRNRISLARIRAWLWPNPCKRQTGHAARPLRGYTMAHLGPVGSWRKRVGVLAILTAACGALVGRTPAAGGDAVVDALGAQDSVTSASIQDAGCANLPIAGACMPECVTMTTDQCKASFCCTNLGQCTMASGACVAASQADCAASQNCARWGHCHPADGRCAAATDTDCASAAVCPSQGLCHAQSGKCVATAAGCAASTNCQDSGRCSQVGDACGAASTADCAKSQVCVQHGQCTLANGNCAAVTSADCAGAKDCSVDGLCHTDGGSGQCFAATNADCQTSTSCLTIGHCSYFNPDGYPSGGRCGALTDADCTGSLACKNEGACSATEKYHTCAKSPYGGGDVWSAAD